MVVLDTIAVFPRRELRGQPFARVDAIARALNCNLIRARRIGDLKDFLGQQILMQRSQCWLQDSSAGSSSAWLNG